jgi:hypothetical protein
VTQGRHADAVPARFVDRSLHRLLPDDLAVAEVAIEHRDRLGLPHHLGGLVGHDCAVPHLSDVLRHADHAMRVVAGEIGADQLLRHLVGLVRGRAGGRENGGRERTESVCRDLHGGSPVQSVGSGARRTSSLPKFAPSRRPMKAAGAFSSPSRTSSR